MRVIWSSLGRGLPAAASAARTWRSESLGISDTRVAIVGIDVTFNVQDPEALQAIDAYTGRQITAISQTTREAVQGIVTRTFNNGLPLAQQIAEIAEVVGLTGQQALSLSHFRDGLREAGEKPQRITALVEQKAKALRRQRAEVIARSESMQAIHVGQFERTAQSIRENLLDASRVKRFWIIAADERLCPICAAIPGSNSDGVGQNELFVTAVGALPYPPAHPLCRCTISLKVSDL